MDLPTIAALVVAAVVIGFAKTAVSGAAAVAVAIFAAVLPARESTAAMLMVLIVGDLIAIRHYRKHVDWALVRGLVPAVLPGLALGALFLAAVDDTVLRRSIAVLLLALVLVQLAQRRSARPPSTVPHRGMAALAGVGAGFATMTANSAGGVMTVYLAAQRVDKVRFVGTGAWFFFGVNLSKLPFSIGLGLLHWADVWRAVALVPAVLAGARLGLHLMRRISQARFEQVVLVAAALAAIPLLVR